MSELLKVERSEGIAWVTIDRADAPAGANLIGIEGAFRGVSPLTVVRIPQ